MATARVRHQTDKAKGRARAARKPKFWSYSKDYDKFPGEYIAFQDDRIVAHGADARKVLRQARDLLKRPTLEKVLPRRLLY